MAFVKKLFQATLLVGLVLSQGPAMAQRQLWLSPSGKTKSTTTATPPAAVTAPVQKIEAPTGTTSMGIYDQAALVLASQLTMSAPEPRNAKELKLRMAAYQLSRVDTLIQDMRHAKNTNMWSPAPELDPSDNTDQ